MNRQLSLMAVFGLGLGAMYFLDPHSSRRRRALVRKKMFSAAVGNHRITRDELIEPSWTSSDAQGNPT